MVAFRGERGFSLVEAGLGMVMLGIAFAGLMASNRGQRAGLVKTERVSEALRLAVTTLENDKTNLSAALAWKNKLTYLKAPHLDSVRTTGVAVGARTYTVDLIRESVAATTALMKIRVRVSWTGHSVVLNKLVAAP